MGIKLFLRNETRVVRVGDILIGGGNTISVQSMTNTDTRDAKSTINQIKLLEEAGCDLVRVAVPDMEAADSIKEIKKAINIPLVCDIHFDYRLALECIKNGVDKVRINPGNIGDKERAKKVVLAAKERNIPIRIGINGGSLDKKIKEKYGITKEALVESAMEHVLLLESMDFYDIVISIKSSNLKLCVDSYLLMAEKRNYPLHVGVTEAGTFLSGTIKSSVGIGAILLQGIGDTMRVSLTGNPVQEIEVGKGILQALELGGKNYTFISCPTCGRTGIELIEIANQVEKALSDMDRRGELKKHITVAVMGCAVNGPGEASVADIGIAGGKNEALLFSKGQIVGKLKGDSIAEQFIQKIREF